MHKMRSSIVRHPLLTFSIIVFRHLGFPILLKPGFVISHNAFNMLSTTQAIQYIHSAHWGRYQMAAISPTTFSNVISWVKKLAFRLKFLCNIPTLVQIMAWWLPGDKPLIEPIVVKLSTYMCVTRPQWAKSPISIVIYQFTTYTTFESGVSYHVIYPRWRHARHVEISMAFIN